MFDGAMLISAAKAEVTERRKKDINRIESFIEVIKENFNFIYFIINELPNRNKLRGYLFIL